MRALNFSSWLRKVAFISAAAAVALPSMQAQAYLTFFGEDLTPGNGATVPLATTPNADAAQSQFLALLTGVGTETFETIPTGTSAPLTLTFPGAGTATLSGAGNVASVTPGTTNGFGRYSVPSPSSSRYWETSAGGAGAFTINFNDPVAGFGFYGIDLGDFGGLLSLVLSNGTTLNVPNIPGNGTNSPADGSVLFFGVVAQGPSQYFTSVVFNTSGSSDDAFAFDRMTIASPQQVLPEPASLALLGIGLAGLGVARRRKLG